ncbi:hypothetical protein BX600DRAFT_496126 [Xylariales sp. PMI_506]|nr:hypothetical protein BX600DRAFT_496126 [Xylariales sp. PMI_506]
MRGKSRILSRNYITPVARGVRKSSSLNMDNIKIVILFWSWSNAQSEHEQLIFVGRVPACALDPTPESLATLCWVTIPKKAMGNQGFTALYPMDSDRRYHDLEFEEPTIHQSGASRSLLSRLGSYCIHLWKNSWALEYMALALSIIDFFAIFALLMHFNELLTASWSAKLSINTVASILATGLKGTSLVATTSALGQLKWAWYSNSPQPLRDFETLDYASRGPLGALLLFWRLPLSILAYMGSLVILIGLVSDAAIQESISQSFRTLNSSTASVPVASNYNTTVGAITTDPLLMTAMYAGVFNADILSDNNNLGPYGTLQYIDGSNTTLEQIILPLTATWATSSGKTPTMMLPFNTTQTNGTFFGSGPINDDQSIIMAMFSPQPDLSTTPPAPKTSIESLPMVESFTTVFTEGIPTPTGAQARFDAYHCFIEFGMQLLNGSVSNGVFTESPLDWITGNWTFESDSETTAGSYWSLHTEVADIGYEVNIDYTTWSQLALVMTGYFYGSFNLMDSGEQDILNAIFTDSKTKSPIGVDAIYDEVVGSFNHYFRTAMGQSAGGTTLVLEPYFKVTWEWLLVPFAMVLMNTIFVLAVRWKSHRLGLQSWRNNPLAFVLHNVGQNATGPSMTMQHGYHMVLGPHEDLDHISDLEKWADKVSVSLRKNPGRKGVPYTGDNDSLEQIHAE